MDHDFNYMKALIKAPCEHGLQRFSLTILGDHWVAWIEGIEYGPEGHGDTPYDALINANKQLSAYIEVG